MATQTTGGGSTTSFTNTPQAVDDTYVYWEDILDQDTTLYDASTGTIFLNVMSNDLGGGAKTLFSIDDGDGNPITSDFELLVKDVNSAGVSPWEATQNGNWVRINNGKIEFRIADGSGVVGQGRSVDSLNGGQNFSDQFVYAIRLGNGTLSQATVHINITGANDAASIAAAIIGDNAAVEAGGVANAYPGDPCAHGQVTVTDVDWGENHFQTPAASALNGTYGTFTFDPNSGQWTYTLDNSRAATEALYDGQVVTETLTVKSYDGTATYNITVTVTGTNDAPVAVADVATATEDAAVVTGSVATNDHDVDAGAVLTYSVASPPAGFTMNSDGSWSFDPSNAAYQHLAQGATTNVVVTYVVTDEHGATATSTLTSTVTGTNDAPVAHADIGATTENATITVDVLANDTDVDDGHVLTVISASAPSGKGTASIVGNQVQFDPGTDFDHLAQGATENVVISYTIEDDHGATSTSTLTITVTGTNDAPVVSGAVTGTATEDGASSTLNALANASDVDDGTTLSVVNVPASLPAGVTYDALTHSFTLDPSDAAYQHLAQGATTTVTVNYGVSDGIATTSASVTWTVTGTNDAPVVSGAVTGSATEDGASSTLYALANASDVDDGAVLSVVNVPASLPAGVTYDPLTKSFTLDPSNAAYQHLAQGATATVTVNYGVSDGMATTAASASWTVTGTNDTPVANPDTATTSENAAVSVSVLGNDTDADDGAILSLVSASAPAGQGTASVVADQVHFDPGSDFDYLAVGEHADVVISYAMKDEWGATSTSTLTITVTGTNDLPDIRAIAGDSAADTLTETNAGLSTSGTLTVTDPDTSDVVNTAVSGVVLGGTTGGLIAADVIDMLTITGGTGTNLAANTGDTHNLAWAFDSGSQAFDFLADGEHLTLSYTLTSSDGHGGTDTQTVTITVDGTNDSPAIVAGGTVSGGVLEDSGTYSASGSFGFTDVDLSDVHGVSATPGGLGYLGTFTPTVSNDSTGDGTGTISWTFSVPDADLQFLGEGETRTQTYTVTVTDGHGGSVDQLVTVVLTGQNDPVVITSAAQSASLSEDGTSAGGTITFNDVDLSDTHTASFVANAANATSLGTFAIDPSVTEAANAANGSLGWSYTVDNAAAQYLAAGESAVEKYDVTFSDGHGGTVTETVTVTITGSNDTPDIRAIAGDSAGDTLDETNLGLSTSGTLTVTDVDTSDVVDTSVSGVVLSGSTGTLVSADVIGMLSITGGTDSDLPANTGDSHNLAWAFDSGSQAFDYLAVGETLTLTYTLTSSDGHGGTDSQDVTIVIHGTNDAPVVSGAVAGAATEDGPSSTLNALANASDVDDGAVLSVMNVPASLPAGVTYDALTHSFTLDPTNAAYQHLAQGATTAVTVNYGVSDGLATTAASVTWTVTGTNDAPVVSGAVTGSATEDGATSTLNALANASDVDDATTLSVVNVPASLPAGVTYDPLTHSFTLDPSNAAYQHLAEGATTTVTVNYGVSDGLATSSASVSWTVTGTNDAPVVVADSYTTAEDTPIVVTLTSAGVLANDTDVDDSTSLSAILVTGPAHGTLALNADGTFTYTPDANYNGPDSFTYKANDGAADSNTVTVSLTVTPVNDAPVAVADNYSTAEDTPLVISLASAGVLGNDTDVDGDTLHAVLVTGPAHGSLALNADGTFTYTPAANYNGPDSFTYKANDGSADSNTVTVNLTVTPVNDAPTSSAGSNSTNEDTPLSASLPAATDVDGDTITYSLGAQASHGTTVVNADGTFTYTPNANYNGSDSFTFTVSDGHGGSNTYTYSLTVNPVNDPPVAAGDSYSTAEDTPLVVSLASAGVLGNDTDVDGDTLHAVLVSGPAHGSLTLNADGTFTYNPAANYNGPDSFTYKANDGTADSNIVTVNLTVTPVNDAPTSSSGSNSTNEDTPLNSTLPAATDVDGDTVTYSLGANAAHGNVVVNANGTFTYTPNADYNGSDSFTFTVSDGHGGSNTYNYNLTVNPVADIVADNVTVNANSGANNLNLLANDTFEDATRFISSVTQGAHGTVTINNNGTPLNTADDFAVYTPNAGYTGSDSFTYTVTSGGVTETATVSVTVVAANVAPSAIADTIIVSTSTTMFLSADWLLNNDIDADGDHLTITSANIGSLPSGWTVTPVTASGVITGFNVTTSTANNASATMTYTVSDGNGHTSTANFTIAGPGTSSTNGGNNIDISGVSYNYSYIDAQGGNDTVTGNNGLDTFIGGDGNDTINGGNGNDLIVGGLGDDPVLNGGGGNDVIRGGVGNDTIDGGAGVDLIDFSDSTVSGVGVTFTLGAGGTGSFNASSVGLGTDTYSNIEGVVGTNFNDTLTGNAGDNILRGGGGNDTLNGLGGVDLIDLSDATAGGTFTLGSGGSGTITAAGIGTDTYSNMEGIIGTSLDDVINGNSGDNVLQGGAGNDTLNGGDGNDTLIGGAGANILTGGNGNDTFVITPPLFDADTITDFNVSGSDTIDITQILSVASGTNVIADGYLRVTTTGLLQVDTNGGGDSWVTIANINAGPASYSIQYLLAGAITTVSVTPVAPPIGIDLDGDGFVSFIATSAGATFDYGAGKVATAWVAPNDGILVNDANHDGQVSANEIVFATSGSDLQGLALYDTNHDGQISSADAGFANFQVWQDANSNGVVDAGEMKSLMALGIASISLSSDGISYSAANGDVQVVGTGSYTRTDGTTGVLADAVFSTGSAVVDQQTRATGSAASNAAIIAAVAAAGLASEPLAAATVQSGDASQAPTLDAAPVHTQAFAPVALDAVAGVHGTDVASQLIPGGGEHMTVPASNLYHADQVAQGGIAGGGSSGGGAQLPAELLQGSEAPVHDQVVGMTQLTAAGVAVPSAEQLLGLAPHPEGAVAAQHDEVVGKVLADALHGGPGGTPDIEALLAAVPQQAAVPHAGPATAANALASDAHLGVLADAHNLAVADFAMSHAMAVQLAVHADAPPPAA